MIVKNKDIRSFMRSLPILAKVLSKKLGVKVQIGGAPCTNGETIYLPPLPLDGGEELFNLANGFIDHEAAHVRDTDFAGLDASGLNPLSHHLFNIVEDMRVERELARIYPGCREHFKKMYGELVKGISPGGAEMAGHNVSGWLMAAIFQEQYPDVDFPVSAFLDAVNDQFPSLAAQLEQFLQAGLACGSTSDSIEWGIKVEKFLCQYFDKVKPKKENQSQPSTGDNQEAGSDGDDVDASNSEKDQDSGHFASETPGDGSTDADQAAGEDEEQSDSSEAPAQQETNEETRHDEVETHDGNFPQSADGAESVGDNASDKQESASAPSPENSSAGGQPAQEDERTEACTDRPQPSFDGQGGDSDGDEPVQNSDEPLDSLVSGSGSSSEEQENANFRQENGSPGFDRMDEQPAQKDSSAGTDENAGYSETGLESGDAGFGNGGDPGAGGSESEPYEDGADTGDIPGMGASSPGSESENSDAPNGTGKASTDGHEEQNEPQCAGSGPSFDHSDVEMLDHLIQGADSDELTDEVRGALGSMVHSEGEMPRTLGDTLKQILERISGESGGSECLRVAVVKGGLPGEMPKPLLEEAYSATKVMATRLSGLLQTQTLSRPHTGRRGRVDGARLHRLAVQNPRVFQWPAERQGIDTAVHILLDCSSSMEECMPLANAACFSVASALRRIRGVNVGVTAFPGTWDYEEPCTVAPILKHGQRMHTRFAARAYGSTPMGEALWWTCQEMMTLKEERKIVLILTDGHPDSIPNTEAALDAARAMGLEVIGIGIGQYGEYILKLIENSRVINVINELAPAMFGVLQQALTEKGPQ